MIRKHMCKGSMHIWYRVETNAAVLCSGRCTVLTWMYNSQADVQGPMCNEQCTMQMCRAKADVLYRFCASAGVQCGHRWSAASSAASSHMYICTVHMDEGGGADAAVHCTVLWPIYSADSVVQCTRSLCGTDVQFPG
jgi:hypothetical protein